MVNSINILVLEILVLSALMAATPLAVLGSSDDPFAAALEDAVP
jgi:hypothetical protein